jgi:hypothetical protein
MKLFLGLVWVLIFGACTGCTTFYQNSGSVNRACKSGVAEYSDDITSFKCFDRKEVLNAHQGVK